MKNRTIIRFTCGVDEKCANRLMDAVEKCIKKHDRQILLLISSPGGAVSPGIAIYNYLKGIPLDVETYNFGQVDSIAAVIFAAGKRRYSSPDARFMIHSVSWEGKEKTYDQKKLEEIVESLAIDRENIAKILADNCKKTPTEIKEMMKKGTTLEAKEAKEIGLVTDITHKLIKDFEEEEIIGIG